VARRCVSFVWIWGAVLAAVAARPAGAQPADTGDWWWRAEPGTAGQGGGEVGASVQWISGYTARHSYAPGETIRFHISTNSPTYTVHISRMQMPWWTHTAVVASYEGLQGWLREQPPEGWLGADWPLSLEAVVGGSWTSGCYIAQFVTETGAVGYHPFVVRPALPGSGSRIAYIANFSTLAAYNDWGGRSFYTEPRTFQASLLRPFKSAEGLGRTQWYFRMLAHLEELGYELDYLTEWDVELDPGLLRRYDIVVLAGHHEYVTTTFYDALQDHHDRGGHIASFDADGLYWQVRYLDNGELLVGYKEYAERLDPLFGRADCLVTTAYNAPLLHRPAAALRGVQRHDAFRFFLTGDYTMAAEDHWIFAGTGIRNGEVFGTQMASAEQDTVQHPSPRVDILLRGVRDQPDPDKSPPPVGRVYTHAVYYADTPQYGFPEGNGGMVFTAGTITGWIRSMYDPDTGWMVKLATSNILDGMLASPPPPFGGGSIGVFCTPCRADLNGDGMMDTLDVLLFLPERTGAEPEADCNHEAEWDPRDVLAFFGDWGGGCG